MVEEKDNFLDKIDALEKYKSESDTKAHEVTF